MRFCRLLAVCGLLAAVGCSTTSEVDGFKSTDLCWAKCTWCVDFKFFCGDDISIKTDDHDQEVGDPAADIKGKAK